MWTIQQVHRTVTIRTPIGDPAEIVSVLRLTPVAAATLRMAQELDPITRGHLDRGIEGLVDEFRGIFSRETIERYVNESLQGLPAARFADFIPVLVHRFTRERLRALGQAEGTIAKDVPEVLFVCVQNSGRSQMAAGLLHQRAAGLVHVRSAGSDPAQEINANVVRAMEEIGVDLSQEFPKPLTDEVVRAADAVITMAAAMPARSTPESSTKTGRSRIPPRRASTRYGRSATRWTAASPSF